MSGTTINALDRALDIIVLLYHEKREMGVTEISKQMGVYKSTIFRTLTTLEDKGFIRQNPENGKYWLGLKFYAIGMVVGEKTALLEAIKPFAKRLHEEFNEVVNVSVLERGSPEGIPRSILIHKEYNVNQMLTVLNPTVGSCSVCYCSSVGKCLMAFSKDLDLSKLEHVKIEKFTENTVDNWDDMRQTLLKIRQQGYAIDNEELEYGLTCVGAPVFNKENKVIAAISLSGPTSRMRDQDFDKKVQRVVQTAKEIGFSLR